MCRLMMLCYDGNSLVTGFCKLRGEKEEKRAAYVWSGVAGVIRASGPYLSIKGSADLPSRRTRYVTRVNRLERKYLAALQQLKEELSGNSKEIYT